MASMRFVGRTAVVTGGAGGIGSAVCSALAEEGAAVAVVDVDAVAVEARVESLRSAGAAVVGHALDVRVRDQVWRVMQEVNDKLGVLYVLGTFA